MKLFTLSTALLFFFAVQAQNPLIVKNVAGDVTLPNSKDQNGWQNNRWNGKLFYQGTGTPTKLCVTDGTTAGTKYLADIGSGSLLYTIPATDFIYIITSVFVTTPSFATISEIWKSDGTAAGTVLVKAMNSVPFASQGDQFCGDANNQRNFSVSGNLMFFGGFETSTGAELWRTDGTTAGTYMVKDIKPGNGHSYPGSFCRIGNDVFFRAAAVGLGTTLWKTDGTATGTVEVVVPGMTMFENSIGKINNKMIFFGNDAVNGVEPWVSDGTAAGTFLLADINAGTARSLPSSVQNLHLKFNDKYVFFLADDSKGRNLWRTDGTTKGTIKLTADGVVSGENFSGGGYSAIANNGIYWIGGNEQLYFSDGTPEGTRKISGTLSNIQYMAIYKGAAWFHGRESSVINAEPWRSDGTTANTKRALEVQPGTLPSEPYGFFELNNRLYFFSNYAAARNLYQYNGDMTFNGTVTGNNWKDSANWNSLMPPGITDTVTIVKGLIPNVTGNAFAGSLVMQNGALINIVNSTDSLFIHNNINTGTDNAVNGNGILALKNMSGGSTVLNGTLTAGKVNIQGISSLNGNLTVNTNINLSPGARLALNSSNLLLAGTTSTITNSSNAYVVTNGTGALSVQNMGTGGRTGAQQFPVGTTEFYNPVTLTNTGSQDVLSARVAAGITSSYTGETPGGAAYNNRAVNTTWFINEGTAGGSNVAVTLQWNAAQELTSFDRTKSAVGHYTSGAWQLNTAGAAIGTAPYSFSGNGYTSFSPFGILNDNVVLPIHSVVLSVTKLLNSNKCTWNIVADNGALVTLERSADGVHFTAVHNTAYTAVGMFEDNYTTNAYYRLLVKDNKGATRYSNVVWMGGSNNQAIKIYPTLFTQTITVQSNEKGIALKLYDGSGKLVLQKMLQDGTNLINTNHLNRGIYFYQLSKDGSKISGGTLTRM